ncbi:DNA invertase Pin-like site-specific DNA recombinase [Bradyrhizobium sp. USDA 4524]|uniref:recombinase family protein n=1 Tax=unclassified Bradyrhizobium TaxID=2631580 RepID=UPI0028118773|nr:MULTISPECIES: recombinase family protein [unclassified Bradyrhizobium]MCP1838555.1 DNA invertase Pin-like site-specific DNA recombinase [Bradyrhizobium sp. USDA 4538]MCP1899120.1 DNA invertase Pin-like site-specific DNA recombinase [Bradyrhizobium sp. USDA 4537]MCP1986767.1 DNA invertase Pin-like site-specific DNA recombinase [Bradyrhizobium sp. USDA 4539]
MNKITSDHLSRSAYVYVRQSTPDQLVNNPESRRRQYALATRAQLLGWENVIVIDDDLGRSGGGTARPGFERLLTAICTGSAGAVLAVEASRLARNGRDWHTLLEFCTLVNSLIIDEDGVYDPKLTNDRLLLEHVVFSQNRDSQRERFLIQTPCWRTGASMDDATLFRRPS